MNENRIIQLINNPDILNTSDENHIKWELEKYPFAQSFHHLHLKWKLHFSKQDPIHDIEKLSIYSTHRELIKKLVDCTEKNIEVEKLEENKNFNEENVLNIIVTDENGKKKTDNYRVEEIKEIMGEMETESVHSESLETNNTIEEKLGELEREEKDKKDQANINKLGLSYLFSPKDDEKEFNPDLEDIKKNISSAQVTGKLEENMNIPELEEPATSNELESTINLEEENVDIQEGQENINEEKKDNELVHTKETSKEKLTFNQWLLLSKGISNKKDEKELEDVNKKSQKNIIEEFIENSPKITPPKKGGKSRQELDFKKEEIKDIANLMTITLAQLYIEQGRYDTAIAAYKILSLKYPEKSSYFALEIKKIKKLKNSK